MASRPIEAGSLSVLNILAANPPQYPHNPTEEPREPLTLYISRVPGTRDVILSAHKPQRKNVTAEDVANAWYYVHLDLPSDCLLPSARDASARSSSEMARPSVVSRKPLPATIGTTPESASTLISSPTLAASQEQQQQQQLYSSPKSSPEQSLPPLPPPMHHIPDPWVPPGFHLDQDHSAEMSSVLQDRPQSPILPTSSDTPPPLPNRVRQVMVGPELHAPIARKPVGPRPLSAASGDTTETVASIPAAAFPDRHSLPNSHTPRSSSPSRHSGVSTNLRSAHEWPASTSATSPPPLPPRPSRPPQIPDTVAPENRRNSISPFMRPASPVLAPFQLTLIRRDPATNNQWNIGKVSSCQSAEMAADVRGNGSGSGNDTSPSASQPVIRIRLETSGYAKFRGFPTRRSIENAAASRDSTSAATMAASFSRQRAVSNAAAAEDLSGGFTRNVVMEYTKSWTANIRNVFKRNPHSNSDTLSSDGGGDFYHTAGPQQHQERSIHVRNISAASAGSTDGGGGSRGGRGGDGAGVGGTDSPVLTRPGPGLKARGYMFSSPWDGRCEFRTGNGGRSLKCRHILNGGGGLAAVTSGVAGYNPLVLAQNIRDGQSISTAAAAAITGGSGSGGGGRSRQGSLSSAIIGAVPVSELRFNLPGGDLFRPKADTAGSRSGTGTGAVSASSRSGELYDKIHGHLRKHYHQPSSSTDEDFYDDDDDDDDEYYNSGLDLSLGREAAGGGPRGNRAKLGKLIIYDDGFKMLDLVVAANMGVWWVSWEKRFR